MKGSCPLSLWVHPGSSLRCMGMFLGHLGVEQGVTVSPQASQAEGRPSCATALQSSTHWLHCPHLSLCDRTPRESPGQGLTLWGRVVTIEAVFIYHSLDGQVGRNNLSQLVVGALRAFPPAIPHADGLTQPESDLTPPSSMLYSGIFPSDPVCQARCLWTPASFSLVLALFLSFCGLNKNFPAPGLQGGPCFSFFSFLFLLSPSL